MPPIKHLQNAGGGIDSAHLLPPKQPCFRPHRDWSCPAAPCAAVPRVMGRDFWPRAKALRRKGRDGFSFGRQEGRKRRIAARGFLANGVAAWRLGARFFAAGVFARVLARDFIQNVRISRLFRESKILHDVVGRLFREPENTADNAGCLFREPEIMADASVAFFGSRKSCMTLSGDFSGSRKTRLITSSDFSGSRKTCLNTSYAFISSTFLLKKRTVDPRALLLFPVGGGLRGIRYGAGGNVPDNGWGCGAVSPLSFALSSSPKLLICWTTSGVRWRTALASFSR